MSNCISSKHSKNLLKRIENPVDISHLPFVSRGIQDEQAGVDHLLEQLEKDGIFAKAYKVGFVLHPEGDWLGASPDRLLYDGSKWKLVEVKNWYETNRQKSIGFTILGQKPTAETKTYLFLSSSNCDAGNWPKTVLFRCTWKGLKNRGN